MLNHRDSVKGAMTTMTALRHSDDFRLMLRVGPPAS